MTAAENAKMEEIVHGKWRAKIEAMKDDTVAFNKGYRMALLHCAEDMERAFAKGQSVLYEY